MRQSIGRNRNNTLVGLACLVFSVLAPYQVAGQTSWPENYIEYHYPKGPDTPYVNKNLTYQAYVAKGHEYLRKRNLSLARQQYENATSLWKHAWRASSTPHFPHDVKRAVVAVLNARATARFPDAPDGLDDVLAGAIWRDSNPPRHSVDSALDAVPQTESIARGSASYYYLHHFMVGLTLADIDIEEGRFRNALRRLFQIYHETSFSETTTNPALESYPGYGGAIGAAGGAPAGIRNLSFTFPN